MAYTTRSGRVSKPPVKYEPIEIVTDDYDDGSDSESEECSDLSDSESDSESETESDSDADEHGNLRDFIEYSSSSEDEDL
jgi:hypothetical protein